MDKEKLTSVAQWIEFPATNRRVGVRIPPGVLKILGRSYNGYYS